MRSRKLERGLPAPQARPVGQAVKTPASHAGYSGSNPLRVTKENNQHYILINLLKCDILVHSTITASKGLALSDPAQVSFLIKKVFPAYLLYCK
jgi:hypothetical protein